VANRTLAGSAPDWNLIGHVEPPAGSPNVLLVLIDDAGFGNPATFGGPIATPNYTRIAEGGLRYNRFHVTALCSPTRAALLTGRNSHTVGVGSVGEFAGGFPGYSATLPRDCAPLPRVLRDNGYSTAAFGKWHLTPDGQQGPAGPLDRWPTGWGFDYFYGFLGGGASQWDPCLAENQKIIGTEPEYYDQENPYYLPDAMAGKTIEWLHGVRAQDAHKPFFVYFSTGCSHAPHHVAKAWADKYKGQFDQGWDRLREETFARQKALGVIPADAKLTGRNEAFPAWDEVPDKLKAFYARQMEVYAGFSENADHNVGRVVDAIGELGELDNTVIIWIWGDNGASMEGTVTGSFNELTMQNGIPLTDEMQLQLSERYGGMEAWGGELMDPHYSAAWAWAGNTPFQWGKQVGSHLGGTRNPMVIAWPGRVTGVGGLRSQFTHVTDHPGRGGHPGPFVGGRDRSGADARRDVRRHAHRPGGAGAAHPAVLRDRRQPGDVQGRLVAGDADPADPVGHHTPSPQAVRAWCLGPRCRSGRAVLPARRLQPGARPGGRPSGQGRRAEGAVLGRGRAV
jgi:arylsulfatase